MQAGGAVHPDDGLSYELRQLTRCLAPKQIHLEKPLLRVEKSHGMCHIEAVLGSDRGHSQFVAVYRYRAFETGRRDFTLEKGKALCESVVEPSCPNGGNDEDEDE
jgi:hypothetical protein